MNFSIILLSFLCKSILAHVCEVCENLVQEFQLGLQKSEKSNFGGGNTAWEEKKLGNYATSETRLVHILEKVCPSTITNREKCQYLREEVEEKIEEWWFQVFKRDQSPNSLRQYLCIDHLKVCCPANHYGKSCEICGNYNQSSGIICSGHGKCDGNGTRLGNGTCICDDGYAGSDCNDCAFSYYPAENDSIKTCLGCHSSCDGCIGEGSTQCVKCQSPGWSLSNSTDGSSECVDIDECQSEGICDGNNRYCNNTLGSFECANCDRSCDNCTGAGAGDCVACSTGYQQINGRCEDVNECSADSELCRESGEKCTNLPGSYSCDCADGFVKGRDGRCAVAVAPQPSPPPPPVDRSKKVSSSPSPPPKGSGNRKKNRQAKKIWTKRFEREFFKLLCCIALLAAVSYWFGYYSTVVVVAAFGCGYFIYYKSIKLDQIFSKSVIV